MSPAFRSLLWKEWSERRHLFWCGLGILLLFTGYCVAYEIEYRTRAFVAAFYSTCTTLGWMGAILLAMSTARGEYSQRTLQFSASLPVSLGQVAWARLIAAWVCLAGPILCVALLIAPFLATGFIEQAGLRTADYGYENTVQLPDRPSVAKVEAIAFLGATTALAVVVSIHAMTLVSLIGTWARSEESVGFLGAIAALLSMSLTAIRSTFREMSYDTAADWIGAVVPESMAISWGYGDWDGSSYADLEVAPLLLGPLVANALFTLALAAWFARRYGCRANSLRSVVPRRSWRWIPRLPALVSRLGIRWPDRFSALIWLNARQSVALCLAGLAMAVLITGVGFWESRQNESFVTHVTGELVSSTWFVGAFWGAIVAVAIFSSELKPGLEQFWRSRPISPRAWFWTKYIVGLAALLITLDLVPMLLSRASVHQSDLPQVGMAYVACVPLLHAMIYSMSVAAICRVRHPIHAAIVALMAFVLLDKVLQSIPVSTRLSTLDVYNQLNQIEHDTGKVDLTSQGYPIVYGIVLALMLGSVLYARRMVLPAFATRAGAAMLLLSASLLLSSSAAATDQEELRILDELLQRSQKRDALLQHSHQRLSTHLQRFPAFYEAAKQQAQGRRRPASDSAFPTEVRKQYDLFCDGSHVAWTETDTTGQVISKESYDGSLRRTYTPRSTGVPYQGTIMMASSAPRRTFMTPDTILRNGVGIMLAQLMSTEMSPSVALREVDGEKLIEIRAQQSSPGNVNDGSVTNRKSRYEITVNQSRGDWPVRSVLDFVPAESDQVHSRRIVTVMDWMDAGSLSIPKRIVVQDLIRLQKSDGGSADLVPASTQETTVEFFELNPEIKDSIFAESFPAGSRYYDMRDRQCYEVDQTGATTIYVPQPKGVRGTVLAFHLIWITVGLAYLVTQSRRIGLAG